jgi:hypothetical protein
LILRENVSSADWFKPLEIDGRRATAAHALVGMQWRLTASQ